LGIPTSTWLAIAGVTLLLLLISAALVRLANRAALKRRFGPEYERAVEELGTERAALRELRSREARVRKLKLRGLSEAQMDRADAQWLKVQAMFVENPLSAVRSANLLIKTIMQARGFKTEHFEQRLADLSVEHAEVVRHYREARVLSEMSPDAPNATENMRRAMVHYAAVVDELLRPTAKAAAAFRELRAS
jgi:hypothetical protein